MKTNIYLTIIDKDLEFVYSSKHKVGIWHNDGEIQDEFESTQDDSNLTFRLTEIDDEGNETPLSDDIISDLKTEGNLIFVHPDSL